MSPKTLIETIFQPDERICLGMSPFDTKSCPINEKIKVLKWFPFLCINPLNGNRLDKNVSSFRNFLIEFDGIVLEDQLALVRDSCLPYTACVFSGKKSYHFIISLKDPVGTEQEWRRIVKWLFKVFPTADQNIGNPSRFTRTPGAIRPDTKKEQTLIDLRSRISKDALVKWLESKAPEPKQYANNYCIHSLASFKMLRKPISMRTRMFLKHGAPAGTRNNSLFACACNLFEAGFTEDDVEHMVKMISPEWAEHHSSWSRTVRSALERVQRNNQESGR